MSYEMANTFEVPAKELECFELSAEGSARTVSSVFFDSVKLAKILYNVNALSVLRDPSADSAPRSSASPGTSKLSFVTQFRMRSGQAVNGEGSTPTYDSYALSVLTDPSAESSLRSLWRAGTSKLSFFIQFRMRSGQAVTGGRQHTYLRFWINASQAATLHQHPTKFHSPDATVQRKPEYLSSQDLQ